MTAPTATPPVGSQAIPSPKQQFLDALKQEHSTTKKVVEAFPADQSEFKPHPRSNSARQLVWTFAVEERLILSALKNQLNLGGGFPKAPDTWDEVVATFKETHADTVAALESARDEDLAGTVKFFTAPKTMGDVPKPQFMWFMLCDQIHHRGQLSVYLRMAGGKVPSIYGPSADEPWM
jgi:uncharacterized damage-inducible protein DinB